MLIRVVILMILISSCKDVQTEEDYPRDMQYQVLSRQAKYESITKDFPVSGKNSNKVDDKCTKIEGFVLRNYDKVLELENNDDKCFAKMQKNEDLHIIIVRNDSIEAFVLNKKGKIFQKNQKESETLTSVVKKSIE